MHINHPVIGYCFDVLVSASYLVVPPLPAAGLRTLVGALTEGAEGGA